MRGRKGIGFTWDVYGLTDCPRRTQAASITRNLLFVSEHTRVPNRSYSDKSGQ